MQSEELIKKIIAEALFNVQADKLPIFWHQKVNEASKELYIHVLKPLKMINSILMDSEEKLKMENLLLQQERSKLLNQMQRLEAKQGKNSKKENL